MRNDEVTVSRLIFFGSIWTRKQTYRCINGLLYLMFISGISQICTRCISSISQVYLRFISGRSWVYPKFISATSPTYLTLQTPSKISFQWGSAFCSKLIRCLFKRETAISSFLTCGWVGHSDYNVNLRTS